MIAKSRAAHTACALEAAAALDLVDHRLHPPGWDTPPPRSYPGHKGESQGGDDAEAL